MNEQVKLFIESLGAVAEASLAFFRSVIQAGGTIEEATKLTQAMLIAIMASGQDKNGGVT